MSLKEDKNQKNFTEKATDTIMKIAGPLGKFGELKAVQAIQEGLTATMPIIIIGSLFLVLALFGMPVLGTSGKALIPALEPHVSLLTNVNSMTLAFVGFYTAFTVAHSYGKKLELDSIQSGLIGLVAFFFITFTGPEEGLLSVEYFGANGMFVAMISSLVSIKIYHLFIKNNIAIKLPDSVPPNVGNAFSSLLPMSAIVVLAWFIRSILNINVPEIVTSFLAPLINGADSLSMFTLISFLAVLMWAIGLNGPGMLSSIILPLTATTIANNSAALVAGEELTNIFSQSFLFSYLWIASIYPLLLLMFLSKNKGFKALSIAAIPPAFFNIIEPTMFGTPVVMNIYLMIPFVITGTVGPFIAYLATSIGFVAKPIAEIPWATPPIISGVLTSGGDWKALIVQAVVFVIGLIIYLPFFKIFEKKEAENALNT